MDWATITFWRFVILQVINNNKNYLSYFIVLISRSVHWIMKPCGRNDLVDREPFNGHAVNQNMYLCIQWLGGTSAPKYPRYLISIFRTFASFGTSVPSTISVDPVHRNGDDGHWTDSSGHHWAPFHNGLSVCFLFLFYQRLGLYYVMVAQQWNVTVFAFNCYATLIDNE